MYKVLPVDRVTPPALAAHEAIVISADNLKSSVTFHWQRADFGVPAAVEYTLWAKVGEGDEPPTLVSSAYGDNMDVLLSTLNTSAIKAGAAVGAASDVRFTLTASISSSYPVVTSAPLTVNVTGFSALPEALHLIGNVLGSQEWQNANCEYVMFRDDNLSANVYTSNFRAGGFKFIGDESLGTWNDLYGQTAAGVLGNRTGDDISDITAAGYYTVTADLSQLTYSVLPYDASAAKDFTAIGLIGVGGDWENDINLTQTDYDPHIWVKDQVTLPAGELKFRANHDWADNWGADGLFPYGKGLGGGANINVPEAGTFFVKFNDLTGHYVFYEK
jgi:hypothetical protein